MTCVAEELRRAQRERVAAMPVGERVDLAFRLGNRDLDLFCAAQKLPRDVGRRALQRARRVGRLSSRVMEREDR